MLGWRMLEGGSYRLDLPRLSDEEEELILRTENRYREATRLQAAGSAEESERLVGRLLAECAREAGLYVGREQEGYLSRMASMHIHGFAFMSELLADDSIEEISVIGPGLPAWVFVRKRGWAMVNACFESEKAIADMANRMARGSGRHITMQNPRMDAMLPDGSRLHASLGPVSAGEMTIRRFRESPFSPRELVDSGTAGAAAMALLSIVMQSDCSAIIAGNTASGKTTTMNALFAFVPAGERILIAEQTPEIRVPHRHQMRLVACPELGIGLKDLVYDSLRMRPDRMVVGEVRSAEEAGALFDVILAGQARGSYATFHAHSSQEALSRLRSLGVCPEDLGSVDLILIQRRRMMYDCRKREGREERRVEEVAVVEGGEAKVIYRPGSPLGRCALLERAAAGFGLSMKEMGAELRERERLIRGAPADFPGFFERVQGSLFKGGSP